MSCDYILPIDRMSLCSTDGLLRSVLPLWVKWFGETKDAERESLKDDTLGIRQFAFVDRPPRVFPIIVTNYRTRDRKRGGTWREEQRRPIRTLTGGPSLWCASLEELVEKIAKEERVKAARKEASLQFLRVNDRLVIPLIPTLGDLIQKTGEQRLTVFDARCSAYAGAMQERARRRYRGLATAIAYVSARLSEHRD